MDKDEKERIQRGWGSPGLSAAFQEVPDPESYVFQIS